MPRAMYICPVCHKNVLASKAIHIKTRYYHKSCLDKKIKKEKEKIDNDKLTKKQREQYERALKQSALPKIPEAVPESEAQAAEKAGTDYIGVGAVFGTSTKKNARNTHAMADVK